MSGDLQRQALLAAEMGLGPLWLRRALPATSVQEHAVDSAAESVVEPVAESAAEPAASAVAVAVDEQPSGHAIHEIAPAWDEPPPAWLDEAPPAAPVLPDISSMGWDELERSVSACTRCGLCEGRTKTVFGVGDRKARWMFIGEGPGREEDQRGEPFVGRAGQLLDNMLGAIALARGANAYIANIVKCRPTDGAGKDRRPSAEEAATCIPYLQRQIALIQPDLIVALGKTAAVTLLGMDPETPVSSLRGKVHRYAERPLVVTYHPAYLLRTPSDKKKAWADLCLALDEYAKFGVPADSPDAG